MRDELRNMSPERFEEFCKELLWLDGFKNVTLNAKGADGGCDLTADRSYPIAHGREHTISWLVQCKHTSAGRPLTLDVVKNILYNFETQDEHQGLIIITNAKLTAGALKRMGDMVKSHHRFIFHWDITDIEGFLDKHPFLIDKFNLDLPSQALTGAGNIRVLVLTDGSVFAYHIFDLLRRYGFDVRESRLHQFGANALSSSPFELAEHFDMVFVFLAELYWMPIEREVVDGIRSSIRDGLSVVFTPFCGWSVNSGVNPSLDDLLPVSVRKHSVNVFRLLLPDPPKIIDMLGLPSYHDTFIENQLVSFNVAEGDMSRRPVSFTGRSTFEFLTPKDEASVLVDDSDGNPVLTTQDLGHGRVAYLNMCAHNCLTPFPLRSPIETSEAISHFIADFALWFGKKEDNEGRLKNRRKNV
ncbi:MAG: restriction endonuclease [Candidatus Aminicenantes bacterium]|nr:restriction endonuclease [Candidatus Aminicenantes bacterium]